MSRLSCSKFASSPVDTFVALAQHMLDPATPESKRRSDEIRVIALLPVLQALGIFELFEMRDPALQQWLQDELAVLIEKRNAALQ